MKPIFAHCLLSATLLLFKVSTIMAASSQEPLWGNTQVINHQGQPLSFYHDLIKGKTVAINFIFTTCNSSCPLATAVFKEVQKQIGAHQVQLISISVDPKTDTPARLNTFARQFNTAAGWDFITGDHAEITELLKAVDVYTPDKTLHTNMVLIGNAVTHQWIRLYGLPSADAIVTALKTVAVHAN